MRIIQIAIIQIVFRILSMKALESLAVAPWPKAFIGSENNLPCHFITNENL